MTLTERQTWPDIAKGVGILLVVYGHVARGLVKAGILPAEGWPQLVDSWIYSFHMPLFFFLAGLFFLDSLGRQKPLGFLAGRIDTLVYPYLIWSLIQGAVEVKLSGYANGGAQWAEVLRLATVPRAHFWFLYALFTLSVAGLLVYTVSRRPAYLAAVLLGALALRLGVEPTGVIAVNHLIAFGGFFSAGVLYGQLPAARPSRRGAGLAIGLLLAALAAQQYVHGVLGWRYYQQGAIGLGLAALSIAALVALCQQAQALGLRLGLAALGQASMVIYLMHVLTGSGVRILLSRGLRLNDPTLHLLAGCLAGVLLPLLADRLLRRWGIGWHLLPPRALRLQPRLAGAAAR